MGMGVRYYFSRAWYFSRRVYALEFEGAAELLKKMTTKVSSLRGHLRAVSMRGKTTRTIGSALVLCGLVAGFGGLRNARAADDGHNPPIHPDCVDNSTPRICSAIVAELKGELALFNRDFNPPNVGEIVKFYHPQVVHYVSSIGRWFRGRDDLRNNFFVPFAANIASASLDFSPYHYQVINPNMVITYGAIPGVVHLKNGVTVVQNPLPQTVTCVRNPEFDLARPFVVLADHE
jgi:hypothetical protein